MLITTLSVVFLGLILSVDGHGRLIRPPGRSTMWRYGFNTPRNSNDHQLSCGGFGVQYYRNNGKCGVCGDPYQGPLENEAGGKYATGTIAQTFRQGQVITVTVEITVNHGGWFEFRLCPVNDPKVRATQECLDKYLLPMRDGQTRYHMHEGLGTQSVQLQLPKDLTCKQCFLQWKWNTASNMRCEGGQCCRGCGPQEQFYGCADIAIVPGYVYPQEPRPTPAYVYPQTPRPTQPPVNVQPPAVFAEIPGSFIPLHPGISEPIGQPGNNKPDNTCRATDEYRRQMAGADTWCLNNCLYFQNCPKDRCTDECRSGNNFKPAVQTAPECKAKDFWVRNFSSAQDANNWCKDKCSVGPCPLDYCEMGCWK